jgi:hypothetical protein
MPVAAMVRKVGQSCLLNWPVNEFTASPAEKQVVKQTAGCLCMGEEKTALKNVRKETAATLSLQFESDEGFYVLRES